MTTKQIIALGGGGFSMETSPFMDQYIVNATRKSHPKVCFVPTASGDADGYSAKFFRRFAATGCLATDLRLGQREEADLRAFACSQDLIYVGGGNTANMLAVWKAHGFDEALLAAYQAGTILAGISAGSICWFEYGITDSFGPDLQPLKCLGFLEGSNCPHYDGEPTRRPAYQQAISDGLVGGYAADDGVALHFVNGKLGRVVSSRVNARAYRTELVGGKLTETPLEATMLKESLGWPIDGAIVGEGGGAKQR